MKRTALFLIVIAVAASGCVGLNGGNEKSSQAPKSGATDTNTVTYTGSSFQPERIVIEQGETVTWTNEGGGGMWVASDRHPTHTNYDGTSLAEHCSRGSSDTFDQCESSNTYSFTFEKTGTWNYHNHVNPAATGTVVVR